MRKIIKDAIHCKECGSMLQSEEHNNFCDNCQMKIETNDWPRIDIFWKGEYNSGCGHKDDAEFCSFKCAREWLLKFPYNKDRVEFIGSFDDLQILLGDKKEE